MLRSKWRNHVSNAASDVQRMRRVALQLAVALDPADHRRVEAETGVEQEAAAVDTPEPDARERAPAQRREQHVRRGDRVERDAERARVDVGRAAGKRRERGVGAGQAVGGLVERAVAGEHRDDVEAVVRGGAREAGRVAAPRRLGDLDLVLVREQLADQDAPAGRDRGSRGVHQQEDPHRTTEGTRTIRSMPVPARDRPPRALRRGRRVPGLSAARRLARSRSRARSGRPSATRSTGAGRCPASAIRRPGCWSSGSRRPRTAGTAPVGSSPAIGPATSCSRRSTAPGSRTSRRRNGATTACGSPTCTSRPRCVARRRRTSRRPPNATSAGRTSSASSSCSTRLRVVVVLGAFGYEAAWSALETRGLRAPGPPAAVRARARGRRAVASRSSARSTRASRTRSPAGSRRPCSTPCSLARELADASVEQGDELADRVDRRDDAEHRADREAQASGRSTPIVRFAPIRAPGITPMHSGIANAQSMWPSNACVIVPGTAKTPTHASDVATVSFSGIREPRRERRHHEDAAADAEQSREAAGRDADHRDAARASMCSSPTDARRAPSGTRCDRP